MNGINEILAHSYVAGTLKSSNQWWRQEKFETGDSLYR